VIPYRYNPYIGSNYSRYVHPKGSLPTVIIISLEFVPIIGGVSHAVTRFATFLAKSGFHVIVATFFDIDRMISINIGKGKLTIVYIKSYRRFVFGFSYIKLIFKVLKLVKRNRERPIVIMGEFFGWPTIISALLGKVLRVPSIARGHGSDVDIHMLTGKSIQVKLSLKLNTLLLGTNPNFAQKIRKASKRSDVSVLSNLINYNVVDDHIRDQLKQKLGLQDGIHCLVVSRLTEFKGVDVVLKAFTLLKNKPIYLHIFGEGPLRPSLERYVKEHGLSGKVFLHGKRPNEVIIEFMRACDIFIMPSRREGLSSAILEALSCGLPIIASNVGGNKFVVKNGYNGFLYSPENYEELAKLIDILAEDHELRKLMGKRSIEIWNNNFSPSSVIRNFLRIIRTVLK